MTMLDAPGTIARPPAAVAVQVPTNMLQSAVALKVPPWANEAVYLKRSAAGTSPPDAGSRVVNEVSCQLVPTRSPPGGGVGAGVGEASVSGSASGSGVGCRRGCRRRGRLGRRARARFRGPADVGEAVGVGVGVGRRAGRRRRARGRCRARARRRRRRRGRGRRRRRRRERRARSPRPRRCRSRSSEVVSVSWAPVIAQVSTVLRECANRLPYDPSGQATSVLGPAVMVMPSRAAQRRRCR